MKRMVLWSVAVGLPSAFLLWFFRDPERTAPSGSGIVVSPADGLITDVEVGADGKSQVRISIRLSLFDVHVTRAPVAGPIVSVDYRPGRFRNAYSPASSRENEQNRVTIGAGDRAVLLVQIAGMLARRIVFHPHVGDTLRRGQRVGMIRFGSRVDLYLPDDVTVLVTAGERVYGGTSIVAREAM